MNMDKETLCSEAQTIAALASTIVSTNTIDLGAAETDTLGNALPKDAGRADLQLLCQIVETVASGGAATVTFQVITSASADLGSPTVVATTGAIALATMVAGYQARLWVPFGLTQRYLGLQYVIAAATTTAGKVTAGIVNNVSTWRI